MTERSEKSDKRRPIKRPKRSPAVQFVVYSVNGGVVPDSIIEQINRGIEQIILDAVNDGHRLVTSTYRG